MPKSRSSAKSTPPPQSPKRQGGSATSFVFGMIFGLLVALGAAWYLGKAELPFSGVTTQGGKPNLSPGPNQSPPDPNSGVYHSANSASNTETPAQPDAPIADTEVAEVQPFEQPQPSEPGEPVARTLYYLQLGSFRDRDEAEQLRARLAFIGTESEVAVGEVNGMVVNRVRVGPFSTPNEAYQSRIPLTKAGFEATVVKE